MNSKTKGGIGCCKVVQYFIKNNYPVFSELFCDNSEIDLIVQLNNCLKTIQVRTTTSKDNIVELNVRKLTPGTRKKACQPRLFSDAVDVFALYVEDLDKIIFINRNEIVDYKRAVRFRFSDKIKNFKCRYAEDYDSINFVL